MTSNQWDAWTSTDYWSLFTFPRRAFRRHRQPRPFLGQGEGAGQFAGRQVVGEQGNGRFVFGRGFVVLPQIEQHIAQPLVYLGVHGAQIDSRPVVALRLFPALRLNFRRSIG